MSTRSQTPRVIVMMGVSGTGKSLVGAAIAHRIGGTFVDADDLHSAEAIRKMTSGVPLTDADRLPWLSLLADRIRQVSTDRKEVVVACSALKRSYRDFLREAAAASLFFVHLHGDAATLATRLRLRPGHFMPPSLLASQLAALEPLESDELGEIVDITGSPRQVVDRSIQFLHGSP